MLDSPVYRRHVDTDLARFLRHLQTGGGDRLLSALASRAVVCPSPYSAESRVAELVGVLASTETGYEVFEAVLGAQEGRKLALRLVASEPGRRLIEEIESTEEGRVVEWRLLSCSDAQTLATAMGEIGGLPDKAWAGETFRHLTRLAHLPADKSRAAEFLRSGEALRIAERLSVAELSVALAHSPMLVESGFAGKLLNSEIALPLLELLGSTAEGRRVSETVILTCAEGGSLAASLRTANCDGVVRAATLAITSVALRVADLLGPAIAACVHCFTEFLDTETIGSGQGSPSEEQSHGNAALAGASLAEPASQGSTQEADEGPQGEKDQSPGAHFYGERWAKIGLAEWLDIFEAGQRDVVTFMFPNQRVREEYLSSIGARDDEDVRRLLRAFLVSTGEYGADRSHREWIRGLRKTDVSAYESAMRSEYNRRLMRIENEPVWQGLSWILDLVDRRPERAIAVIDSFLDANLMFLPDGIIWGLGDAQALIRAKWVGSPETRRAKLETVFSLGHRNFEHLIDELYHAMGYKSELTPPRRDHGRDVLVSRLEPALREDSRVECKLWRGRVGVQIARALLGVVSDEKATKGVLVATGGFTRPTIDFADRNPRLELIGPDELMALLDRHLGIHWATVVDLRVNASKKRSDVTGRTTAMRP